jgi:hypothetical protein
VTPSATTRLHTTATHTAPSTTEIQEHHCRCFANIITPEDGRIRSKHVESYNACNKAIPLCIKLVTYSPYETRDVCHHSVENISHFGLLS